MKKTYIIPVQRWAIMEENFLVENISMINGTSGPNRAYAIEENGMEAKGQYSDDGNAGGNVWNNEW